jgi:hypothetical protein
MGDVQRRYQAIPYGWREIDIASLAARLIAAQKIEIRYGGAVVEKGDKNLVRYLRVKSEADKASVTRRIAPSEQDMRKSVEFLRKWLDQMSIPEDEDGLAAFVKEALAAKVGRCDNLLVEYSHDSYPGKEAVEKARDAAADVLSCKNSNVALLKRLLERRDDLFDAKEDMEEVETFFKSQRPVFDSARKLELALQGEGYYFAQDRDAGAKIGELSEILAMPRPYVKIMELPGLAQSIRASYDKLLERKKEEVQKIIARHLQDVRTLAGEEGRAAEELKRAEERFAAHGQKAGAATSLTALDAAITQLQNLKDHVCSRIEALLREAPPEAGGEAAGVEKITRVHRYDMFPAGRLTTKEEVDGYVEIIRQNLYAALEESGGVQIN